MTLFQPRTQLLASLLLAGAGLWLFFGPGIELAGLSLGFVGVWVFVAAVWFFVDAVHRIPRSEAELAIAPGEWQAWVGVVFMGAVIVYGLATAHLFRPEVPIGRNPEAGAAGEGIGALFVAWLVLSYVLKQRWAGKVQADERDARIELVAGQWGRWATASCVIGIAVMLGFSDTERLREFSYPFIAQMLMFALLWGVWFDHAVAAVLYWRDRRAAAA